MDKRLLGYSGLATAPIIFGGNVFGWTVDAAASFQLLDAFVDAGFNMVDTANSYSRWAPGNKGGESETVIGQWFQRTGKRDRVILATKVGSDLGPGRKGLSKAYIVRAVEESLQRLRTDTIDLYQSHRDDPTVPQEEALEAYAQLLQQGKVKAIGASNFTAQRLTKALEISQQSRLPRYETLQPLYNLYDRSEFEGELESVCRAHGLGVIPYFPLASGFLTGKYRAASDLVGKPRAQFLEKYFTDRGQRILAALHEVANLQNVKPVQVALAWLIGRPAVTAPIVSATSLSQLREILAAAELRLDSESTGLLDQASA